jgi:hypothetical protein
MHPIIALARRYYAMGNLTELRQLSEIACIRLTDSEFGEYMSLCRSLRGDA